ncbi:MAG: hypothetical protein A2X55_09030 [Nitrospirae bacterium GWB2_47_37]|nr:MAG: hypothetical protein A2Z82_02530 [Nitrospirae bacterium GWA2_46_11]OGW23108.1 MAG: hypothetical protein A2X55_09030 [Nitrospirae bacterium GWB2_47_37]HAK87654.1 hypothetical protein [Nitrospiraceae bacterium]
MGKERGFQVGKGYIKFYAFDEAGKHAIVELVRKYGTDWEMKFIDSDIVMAVSFYYNPERIGQQEQKVMIGELIETFRTALLQLDR